jgi:hypothetical protein
MGYKNQIRNDRFVDINKTQIWHNKNQVWVNSTNINNFIEKIKDLRV